MPVTAKLGLQALCLPALSSESITDLPNTLLWEQKMGALPCLGRGWKPTGLWLAPGTEAPSNAGLLQATPQEEKEAGSHGLSLVPVCRHFRPPAQADHPPSSLYPCHGGGNRLREKRLAQLCSREGERRRARRVLGAALWTPSADLVGPLSISAFADMDQCSYLGRGALEGMWHSSARTGLDSEPGLPLADSGIKDAL